MADEIHSTQQLANAAEVFVKALGELFPAGLFEQFFHGDTIRRAYWTALASTLENYRGQRRAALARSLMTSNVLAQPAVVAELLKLFLPGQIPNYGLVAEQWATTLANTQLAEQGLLVAEAETLFHTLANELRRSGDLRLALYQIAQARYPIHDQTPADADLGRLLDTALVAGPGTLTRQVQYLLRLATMRPTPPGASLNLDTLARVAGYLDTPALEMLWHYADQVIDPDHRLCLLGQIAPHLGQRGIIPDPLELIEAASTDGLTDPDPVVITEVLLDLAPHLEVPQEQNLPTFQQRMLAGVEGIRDPGSRVRALGVLIENLPPPFQDQAVALAFATATEELPNEVARALALSELPAHLPTTFQDRLLTIAYQLEAPDARALLLGRIIPYLPTERQAQAVLGALDAVNEIYGDEARAQALIALAPYMEAVGPLRYLPEGLQQAIHVTFSIENPDDRARAFAALAPYLSPELLTEALQAIRDITDDQVRAHTLTRLAPHLPDELQVAAYGIAQETAPAEARALALATIAPYLSATARAQALADALVAALAIERRYERVVALADLAPHLPDDLRARALQEAQNATRSIPDEGERSRALVFLAPYVPDDWLPEAVADAYTILEPDERVPALCALLPRLPDEPRLRVGQDLINLAIALKPPHQKASILAAVAPVLPAPLIDLAVQAATQIDTPYDRMHVLTALLPHQPEHLHSTALEAARAVPNRYQRTSALLELVPHTARTLHPDLLNEALETALGIEDHYDRASALAHLALHADTQVHTRNRQQDALSMALAAALEIPDESTRTTLLARLAQIWTWLLSPAQSYMLWRQTIAFLRTRSYPEVLNTLAALAPAIERIGSGDAIEPVAGVIWDMVMENLHTRS